MALDSIATFPAEIWDGDSRSRDSDDIKRVAPDYWDWARMIREIQAVQKSNRGIDPDTALNSHGTLASVAGLTVEEYGNAAAHKTILTLVDVEVTVIDGVAHATDAAWGVKALYTFPVGHVLFLGAHQTYPLGKLAAVTGGGVDGASGGFADDADIEIGVGTTARANATSFALAAAEDNIVPGQNGVDLTTKTSDAIESSQLATDLFFDGTTACVANLNVVTLHGSDYGSDPDVLKVSGTITIIWTMMGDD